MDWLGLAERDVQDFLRWCVGSGLNQDDRGDERIRAERQVADGLAMKCMADGAATAGDAERRAVIVGVLLSLEYGAAFCRQ